MAVDESDLALIRLGSPMASPPAVSQATPRRRAAQRVDSGKAWWDQGLGVGWTLGGEYRPATVLLTSAATAGARGTGFREDRSSSSFRSKGAATPAHES